MQIIKIKAKQTFAMLYSCNESKIYENFTFSLYSIFLDVPTFLDEPTSLYIYIYICLYIKKLYCVSRCFTFDPGMK